MSDSGERRARPIAPRVDPEEAVMEIWVRAMGKLQEAIGITETAQLVETTLRQIGCRRVQTRDELLRFCEAIVTRGGTIEAIARGMKVQAVLIPQKPAAPK